MISSAGLLRSTRRSATVTISQPEAARDSFMTSGEENFPVPPNSRERNFLPAMVNISTAPHKPYQFKDRAILQCMAPIFFLGQNLPVTLNHHRKGIKAKLVEIISHPSAGWHLPCFAVAENLHLPNLMFFAQEESNHLVRLVVGGNSYSRRHEPLSRRCSAQLIANKIY